MCLILFYCLVILSGSNIKVLLTKKKYNDIIRSFCKENGVEDHCNDMLLKTTDQNKIEINTSEGTESQKNYTKENNEEINSF